MGVQIPSPTQTIQLRDVPEIGRPLFMKLLRNSTFSPAKHLFEESLIPCPSALWHPEWFPPSPEPFPDALKLTLGGLVLAACAVRRCQLHRSGAGLPLDDVGPRAGSPPGTMRASAAQLSERFHQPVLGLEGTDGSTLYAASVKHRSAVLSIPLYRVRVVSDKASFMLLGERPVTR